MVVEEASINNIMGGIESTGGVRLHNHKRKLKQRFDIIKKLGQGTYGKVQLGINKETGQEVAIKTIKKSKIETEADLVRIRREIQIMSSVQHPNIIHIYEVFENREKMVLVMEYAAGGELYDYLSERKVLQEDEARRIFRQIATACYYCHKHKICHRDLKLENILLDDKCNAKIADFGLSNVFDDQRLLNTFCGSPLYASPEIVKGTPYHGPEVDCWSLGVLLYTLVYGAMPFDGSNFKRLVRQISQGDYFEPKSPSPASPLIKDMLTVNPRNRASIEKICTHWWVNEGYEDSCLDISEELANQTPVRLDLLLSLAPPPPQLESDKMVVAGEAASEEPLKQDMVVPTRSQSVGSLMELGNPAERRIKDLISEELKVPPKRKLETTISTDQANIQHDGKRKEKIVKEHTIADITVHGSNHLNEETEIPLVNSATQIISKEMEVEPCEEALMDPSLQGAACAEIMEEAKKMEKKPKVKRTASSLGGKKLEEINEHPSQENISNNVDKENIKANQKVEEKIPEQSKITAKRKVEKKKVLADKNENKKEETPVNLQGVKNESNKHSESKEEAPSEDTKNEKQGEQVVKNKVEAKPEPESPTKPVERRKSRIFEQAEKFQNMISGSENKAPVVEKPKKITIPGVSVGGFRKEFERKASLVSTSPPKVKNTLSKKNVPTDKAEVKEKSPEKTSQETAASQKEADAKPNIAGNAIIQNNAVVQNNPIVQNTALVQNNAIVANSNLPNGQEVSPISPPGVPAEDERKQQLKNAVNIISNAISEGARKSKSRPCIRKPPVPFGASGRSASGSIGLIPSPLSPPPNDVRRPIKSPVPFTPVDLKLASKPEQIKCEQNNAPEIENKTSSAEITLKSATLPRRKTTKAEIQLEYPTPKPATMEFKTEMAHHVEAPPKLPTQRSEVIVPVNSPPAVDFRASSVEPERMKASPKERIIPISFENHNDERRDGMPSPPAKPPMPRLFQSQRSTSQPPQRSSSLSRQSTQESDSETTVSGEPIRKSPREYIIPIAVEGGGYVTPRAGSLEPSETSSTMTNASRRSNAFGRTRRMNSIFSDRDGSEDESPFSTLHRHSSFGKDSDTEDSRPMFHMHRLRSSRPRRPNIEHNDSVSSGEDDDDDGFEIVTAENLFSTLLSRVRDLTQRINVDGSRPSFPGTRLLSHFGHETDFFNRHSLLDPRRTPMSRTFSREQSTNSASSGNLGAPWRRSVSRDLATDIESVFNSPTSPTQSATLPRGDKNKKNENLNLSDLDLKKLKLTEEDALALSYLTPGLSRRIQKQLLAQLPPSEARKLTRTLSMRTSDKISPEERSVLDRRSVDRISSTLPRRYSTDSKHYGSYQNLSNKVETSLDRGKSEERIYSSNLENKSNSEYRDLTATRERASGLPIKSRSRDYAPAEVERPRTVRSMSLREPRTEYTPKLEPRSLRSPDSSLSESYSYKNDDISSDYSSRVSSVYTSPTSRSGSYSLYSPETSTLSKYLNPKSYESDSKPDFKRSLSMSSPRKVSRFLRPDFFDPPKEEKEKESVYLKEKKEREMETQKVLKEIRDKRIKNRVNNRRERSLSRETTTQAKDLNLIDNKTSASSLDYVNTRNFPSTPEATSKINSNVRSLMTDSKNKVSDRLDDSKSKLLERETKLAYGDANKIVESMKNGIIESTELLKNISDNIQKLESNVNKSTPETVVNHDYVNVPTIPDYVNVPKEDAAVVKKERVSKLVRPKSYPTESITSKLSNETDKKSPEKSTVTKKSPDKDTKSKISRLQKPAVVRTSGKKEIDVVKKEVDGKKKELISSKKDVDHKEDTKKSGTKEETSCKNKFLQSIERKFEKLRAFSNSPVETSEEKKLKEDKKSTVESAIRKLREQSLPKNIETCSTESGLIKRAVSVEDFTTIGSSTPLQPSRKSVTKILGLFKKYEDKDGKNVKIIKKKTKDTTKKDSSKLTGKEQELKVKKNSENDNKASTSKIKKNEENTAITNSKIDSENTKSKLKVTGIKAKENNLKSEKKGDESGVADLSSRKSCERSTDSSKSNNGIKPVVKSESLDEKPKSKLPVNYFRRSLNLENSQETPKIPQTGVSKSNTNVENCSNDLHLTEAVQKLDRRNLKLDIPSRSFDTMKYLHEPSNANHMDYHYRDNRNSYTTTDDSSVVMSPGDDDSWSVCSDYHRDLSSPLSPNGHGFSGDEGESVIDRIRRKSFYTRFNEKKRPRKSTVTGNYKDLDLYSGRKSNDYGSLDRKSVDYRRSSYSSIPDPYKKEYKPYTRSSSLLNDGYVNVPNRYQTYNPRITKRIGSLYNSDIEENDLDAMQSTEKSRKYSYYSPSSRLRCASSPREEHVNAATSSNSMATSSHPHNPV